MAVSLRIVFAGTPEFAAIALRACIVSQHEVVAVYTQPDRPAGRGRKTKPGAVKQAAVDAGIPVYQPQQLDAEQFTQLERFNADVMLVSAYGMLLPEKVLTIPRLGCINIHASLLPKWRGAAPVQRAIIAGDQQSGLSIMRMVAALDAGPVLQRFPCEIKDDDTGTSLQARLADIAANEIVDVLQQLDANTLRAIPQDHHQASYAKKLSKQEANINWQEAATSIERKIRAFHAWPVAYTFLNEQLLRVWAAQVFESPTNAPPGMIVAADKDGVRVATGDGTVALTSVQLAGGNVISAQDLMNAHALQEQCLRSAPLVRDLQVSA